MYVLYILMESERNYDHWIKLARVQFLSSCGALYMLKYVFAVVFLQCFHLWGLDARGFHKVMLFGLQMSSLQPVNVLVCV